jgi:hypothetical protein
MVCFDETCKSCFLDGFNCCQDKDCCNKECVFNSWLGFCKSFTKVTEFKLEDIEEFKLEDIEEFEEFEEFKLEDIEEDFIPPYDGEFLTDQIILEL